MRTYPDDQKRHSLVQLALDCLFFWLIWAWSIDFRVSLNGLLHVQVSHQNSTAWTPSIWLILPLWLAFSYKWRIYRSPEKVRFWSLMLWAFEASGLLTAVTAVVTFFSREFGHLTSRVFVSTMFITAFTALLLARLVGLAIFAMVRQYRMHGSGVAVLGDWARTPNLAKRLQAYHPHLIRGIVIPEDASGRIHESPLPVLGTIDELAKIVNREHLERVIILDASIPKADLVRCTDLLAQMDVSVSCAVDVSAESFRTDLSTFAGLPFLEMVPLQFTRRQQIVKRIFDVSFSAVLLVLLGPLLLVLAALIKLTSQGPVLYKSQRVGKGGRYFTFLKFRSMYVNTGRSVVATGNEKSGHIFKMKNDPRVTPIGRILRRFSLDELPQLINVLRGDMSIVGPRPLPSCDLDPSGMSKEFSAWAEGRASVPPGLTGLWQVSGRSDLAFDDMVRLDLNYIENWSLGLDIKIMVDTPLLILRGVGAY